MRPNRRPDAVAHRKHRDRVAALGDAAHRHHTPRGDENSDRARAMLVVHASADEQILLGLSAGIRKAPSRQDSPTRQMAARQQRGDLRLQSPRWSRSRTRQRTDDPAEAARGVSKLRRASSSESNVWNSVTRRVIDSRSRFRLFTLSSFNAPCAFASEL